MEHPSTPFAEHQRFLATLRARVHAQTLGLRLFTLAGVSTWLLVHGQSAEARYLFVAPMLALVGGALEVGLSRRDLLLGALGRLPTALVDTDLVESQVSWRRPLYRSALPWLYLPTAVVAAAITLDTLDARPGWTAHLIWLLALGLSTIAAYAGVLGAWWMDRFGDDREAPPVALPMVASFPVSPKPAEPVEAPVQRTPSLDPPEPVPGPFPVKRTESTTQSFGTPVS